jgi:hypothetical protein
VCSSDLPSVTTVDSTPVLPSVTTVDSTPVPPPVTTVDSTPVLPSVTTVDSTPVPPPVTTVVLPPVPPSVTTVDSTQVPPVRRVPPKPIFDIKKILDKNQLLPPIKHAKLKGLSDAIKILFSNRTFVYNLIEENADNLIDLLNLATYLYTDSKNRPLSTLNIINLQKDIIQKSFCYDPNDTSELDDLLIRYDNFVKIDATKWFKTITVDTYTFFQNALLNSTKVSVKYTHYKRIR